MPADTPESIRRDIEIIQRELPLDILEFLFLTPLPGSEDHKALWKKGVPLDADLNKYDLEHVLTPHPQMSKAEWEALYRDAWAIYYTPRAHRDDFAPGAGLRHQHFAAGANHPLVRASLTVEKVHPLQGGFVRLKDRHERRPELPVEPVWKLYPWLAADFVVKHGRIAVSAWESSASTGVSPRNRIYLIPIRR